MTDRSPRDEDQLARRVLDGLFEIACEDRPASVTDDLHRQIADLPADRCRALVEEMVDTERFERMLQARTARGGDRSAQHSGSQAKVDRVLEPLVQWRMGAEGSRKLEALERDERAHLLFSSLGSR